MTTTLTAAPQPRGTILVGDALSRLQELEAGSIDCVITSPPYFRLRDYQHQGQLGLEDAVQDWVNNLLSVTDEMARVLVPTGTLWLNLGDSYSTHQREGAPRKSLLLGPERLALALIQRGWTLRNKIVWAKTNAIPSSVTDRLSCTHEVIYLLTRSSRYYFALNAIRQPPKDPLHHTRRTPQPATTATPRPPTPPSPTQPSPPMKGSRTMPGSLAWPSGAQWQLGVSARRRASVPRRRMGRV